ncbi:MAG: ATP-binding protein [Bacteroidales bacterium]|nr:ATP-binding protein [Bacteroidales bacterium]
MEKLPIGIQNFEKLRGEGYAYVDKTASIYNIAKGGVCIFLSRPRRFGKSLLLSTFRAYFEGKRHLFEGLAIAQLEQEWKSYPVLYLDLNTGKYDTKESLDERLANNLSLWEKTYQVDSNAVQSVATRFENVIRAAHELTREKVVVLVDEYDKPLLQAINNEPLQADFRNTLKSFYGNLKSCDEHIRFAMLTGVTKFSHISIFSDLNNLQDISLDARYADICGLTADEIAQTFDGYLEAFAQKEGSDKATIMRQMKQMYDGYHFSENMTKDMYNPFSVLNALSEQKFRNFWFSSGTPTFLVKLLQNGDYRLQDFTQGDIIASDLSGKGNLISEPIALFYQTGYLTIKGYNKEFGSYRLGFPNMEVERSFLNFLLPRYVGTTDNRSAYFVETFVNSLRQGNVEAFMEGMRTFFADTPYELVKDLENHYQNVMFTICRLMGYHTVAEYRTSQGRIDMVVQTNSYTYVFEFKFGKTADEALRQIDTKDYMLPFAANGTHLMKVGVNFSKETRNIDDYVWKNDYVG